MRRVATALGTLAAAGALALGLAGSAWGAQGTLFINGQPHENPRGCYGTGQRPLEVTNFTDRLAVVYEGPNCTGQRIGSVRPDEEGYYPEGSVSIN